MPKYIKRYYINHVQKSLSLLKSYLSIEILINNTVPILEVRRTKAKLTVYKLNSRAESQAYSVLMIIKFYYKQ